MKLFLFYIFFICVSTYLNATDKSNKWQIVNLAHTLDALNDESLRIINSHDGLRARTPSEEIIAYHKQELERRAQAVKIQEVIDEVATEHGFDDSAALMHYLRLNRGGLDKEIGLLFLDIDGPLHFERGVGAVTDNQYWLEQQRVIIDRVRRIMLEGFYVGSYDYWAQELELDFLMFDPDAVAYLEALIQIIAEFYDLRIVFSSSRRHVPAKKPDEKNSDWKKTQELKKAFSSFSFSKFIYGITSYDLNDQQRYARHCPHQDPHRPAHQCRYGEIKDYLYDLKLEPALTLIVDDQKESFHLELFENDFLHAHHGFDRVCFKHALKRLIASLSAHKQNSLSKAPELEIETPLLIPAGIKKLKEELIKEVEVVGARYIAENLVKKHFGMSLEELFAADFKHAKRISFDTYQSAILFLDVSSLGCGNDPDSLAHQDRKSKIEILRQECTNFADLDTLLLDPRAIAFINELSEIFNQIFDFKIVLTPTWNMNLKAIKNLFSDFSFAKYITDILPNSMDNFTFLREYCGDIHNTGDLHYVCHYAEIQKYLSEQRMQPQMNLVVTGNNFIHLEKFADDFISTKGSFSEEDFANILIRLKANLWGHDEECKENDFILYTPYLAITQQDIVKTESLEEVEESELSYDDENFLEQDEEVVDFSAQDLQGVDFSRRNFSHGKFVNTNLTNANLSFANLQHADLSGAILRGAKLNKASLKNAILHQADLESADCSSANFSDAILTQANLARAVMTKARFIMADGREANLEEVNLKKANLYDAQFHKATLTNANLKNASLMSAKLNGAILLRAKLVGADLTDANLSGADLQEADFTNADLTNLELRDAKTQGAINLRQAFDRGIKKQKERQEATLLRPLLYVSPIQQPEIPKLSGNFSGMDFTMTPTFFSAPSSVNIFIGANFSKATFLQMVIQDINFSHADFSQACFAGAKLCDVNFMGANLTNANMQDTIITDCIFSESTMNQIILSGARISHSSFHSANMDDADLMKAHFVGTKDEEITLCYASMKRANLNETEFFYADLSEADLSKANLEKAKFNQCAIRETNFLLAQNCSGEVLHYQREQDKNEQIKQQRMKRWESTLRLEEIRIQNFEQKRDEDRKELETEANRRRFVGEIRDDEERVALAYSKLGLVKTEALSESDINKAYRNMIKQFHPDRGGLIEKFNPINEAFEIIQAYLGIGKYSDLPRL